jgi:hypothetical protein
VIKDDPNEVTGSGDDQFSELLAQSCVESANFVLARGGKNASARSTAVRDLPTLAGRSAASGLLLDPVRELSDLIENATAFCHEGADLSISVHHRRMIASAKLLSDLGQ